MIYIKMGARCETCPIIAGMKLPERVPGLKLATVLAAAYAVVWIALEGDLVRVTILGVATSLLFLGAVFQRWLAGRRVSPVAWLALCAALGAILGFNSGMFTLLFMAVKTGLHAHGPEFNQAQINWLLGQLPWWTSAGLLAGLGLGVIIVVARQE